jgi:hypothetical protein
LYSLPPLAGVHDDGAAILGNRQNPGKDCIVGLARRRGEPVPPRLELAADPRVGQGRDRHVAEIILDQLQVKGVSSQGRRRQAGVFG